MGLRRRRRRFRWQPADVLAVSLVLLTLGSAGLLLHHLRDGRWRTAPIQVKRAQWLPAANRSAAPTGGSVELSFNYRVGGRAFEGRRAMPMDDTRLAGLLDAQTLARLQQGEAVTLQSLPASLRTALPPDARAAWMNMPEVVRSGLLEAAERAYATGTRPKVSSLPAPARTYLAERGIEAYADLPVGVRDYLDAYALPDYQRAHSEDAQPVAGNATATDRLSVAGGTRRWLLPYRPAHVRYDASRPWVYTLHQPGVNGRPVSMVLFALSLAATLGYCTMWYPQWRAAR